VRKGRDEKKKTAGWSKKKKKKSLIRRPRHVLKLPILTSKHATPNVAQWSRSREREKRKKRPGVAKESSVDMGTRL